MPPRLFSHTRQEPRTGPLVLDQGNPLVQGLTNYYLMNEGGGPAIYDFAGNTATAPLNGTYTWAGSAFGLGVDFPNGAAGAAPNAWADFGDIGWFEGLSALTIQVILRLATTGGGGTGNVVRHDGNIYLQTHNNNQISLSVWASGSGLTFDNVAINALNAGGYFLDNQLHVAHWVLLGSGVAADNHAYVDGIETAYASARVAWSGTLLTTTNPCMLMAASSSAESATGTLAAVAFWNRALSASECAELALDPYQVFLPQTTRRWFTFGPPNIPPGLGPVVQMSQPMTIPPP